MTTVMVSCLILVIIAPMFFIGAVITFLVYRSLKKKGRILNAQKYAIIGDASLISMNVIVAVGMYLLTRRLDFWSWFCISGAACMILILIMDIKKYDKMLRCGLSIVE